MKIEELRGQEFSISICGIKTTYIVEKIDYNEECDEAEIRLDNNLTIFLEEVKSVSGNNGIHGRNCIGCIEHLGKLYTFNDLSCDIDCPANITYGL